ncbi:MAG: NADH-quinone oxidoreductase subunit C, partial [Reyranella sp.]|nr:NADH-quinone oxidoreductase subunit C [Reyranella sp.]
MDQTLQELGDHIVQATAGAVTSSNVRLGELMLECPAGKLVGLLTFLRDAPKCLFKQVIDICGVDWPEREKRFDVV